MAIVCEIAAARCIYVITVVSTGTGKEKSITSLHICFQFCASVHVTILDVKKLTTQSMLCIVYKSPSYKERQNFPN